MAQGVSTRDDIWYFLRNTVVPLFFQNTNNYGDTLPTDKWGRVFNYNHVVGSVVLETQRSVRKECDQDYSEHMECFPQGELSGEKYGRDLDELPAPFDKKYYLDGSNPIIKCKEEGFVVFDGEECPTQRRLELLRDELAPLLPKAIGYGNKDNVFKMFLYQNVIRSVNEDRLNYLEQRGWLDDQTNTVTIKALYLNNELDIPRLESVRITFFNSRGGGVYGMLRMEAVLLRSYSRAISYVWDILFVIILFLQTLEIVGKFCKSCCKRTVKHHFTAPHLVSWLTSILGWFNVIGFVALSSMRSDVSQKLEAVFENNNEKTSTSLHDAADDFVWYATWYRVFVADAHIVFMFQCFVALKWQPRLAVVTETLKASAVDLFHFAIVLIPTFLAFAIAGHEMFGRRMQGFATMEGAIAVCFKLAMESEFDWWGLSEEDFFTSMTWVWTFVLLVVLLMMNMVLAIMMDTYSVIRLQAGSGETVWANAAFLFRRLYLGCVKGKWMSDNDILAEVENMPRTISIKEIKEAFPDMHEYQ